MSNSEPYSDVAALPADWRYEQTVAEIETIINQIEAGELDLADVFEQFTQAVTYLQQCEAFLGDRQGQLDLLLEQLGDPSDLN